MPVPLEGKTAMVTGASRGIGKSIALSLVKEGVRVALLARSADRLAELVGEIEAQGGRGFAAPCDVTDGDAVDASVEEVFHRLGSLDLLVNNAGIFLEKPIIQITLDEWEAVLKTNLTAPFLLCRTVLMKMRRQKGGRIITIASASSLQGYLHQAAYCASKHGILGFMRCLAIEGRPHNIHVHTICPGAVRTGLIQGTHLADRVGQQPLIETKDISDMVIFLARQPDNIDIPEIVLKRFDNRTGA